MSDDTPQIIYRQDHRAADLHAIVADGLFLKNGTFYVLPKCEMKQLEKIFHNKNYCRINILLQQRLNASRWPARSES